MPTKLLDKSLMLGYFFNKLRLKGEFMCEAAAYLLKNGEEELVLEEVAKIKPVDGKIELVTMMGDKKIIDAKIKEINLLRHKIILTRE